MDWLINVLIAISFSAIYLTYFMMITTLAVAFSVLVIKLHFKSTEHPPPQWLRVLAFKHLARMTCLDSRGNFRALLKPRVPTYLPREKTATSILSDHIMTPSVDSVLAQPSTNMEMRRRGGVEDHDDVFMTSNSLEIGETLPEPARCRLESLYPGRYSRTESFMCANCKTCQWRLATPRANEWQKIAEVLDRLFFFFFCLAILIPTSFILGVVRLFKPEL